jgi:hypothetical protein
VEVLMPGMPYNLEQGPYLGMLEDLINREPVRCLESLRDPNKRVTALLRDAPSRIEGGRYRDTAKLADHIDHDWFGLKPDSDATPTSRYWAYWRGDAEDIVRETIGRAIEVALGLQHDETAPDAPGQRWPISVLTACGIRWFEGWISWRRVGAEPHSGHVLVLLLTPTHGKPAEPTLLRPTRSFPADPPGAPYAVNPDRANGDRGLWAIGAVREERIDPEGTSERWVSPGEFPRPHLGPTYQAHGEVVVVAPSEAQGGVLPGGRRYQEVS